MVLPDSRGVSRAPRYLGVVRLPWSFRYGALTLSGEASQPPSPAPRHGLWTILQPRADCSARFRLAPLRSPLLGGSRLISFPSGTEMFHFPEFASRGLCIQPGMPGHCPRRVSPFRDLRIIGCLAPPRSLSQLAASFIACRRQGIHLALFIACSQKNFPLIPVQL